MDAKELRIGNYYMYAGNEGIIYAKVKTIQVNPFGLLSNIDGTNYGICGAIQLTEEWLLRFGFKKTKESKDVEWYSLNSFDIAIHKEDNNVYIVFQHLVLKHITMVHQLQNLYFALCGKELQLQ